MAHHTFCGSNEQHSTQPAESRKRFEEENGQDSRQHTAFPFTPERNCHITRATAWFFTITHYSLLFHNWAQMTLADELVHEITNTVVRTMRSPLVVQQMA